jgi:hypothetical protein
MSTTEKYLTVGSEISRKGNRDRITVVLGIGQIEIVTSWTDENP